MKLTPIEQAGSVFRVAVTSAASAVAGNQVFSSQSQQENRLKICNNCAHYNKRGNCNVCGCMLSAKVKFAASSCPVGLW